VEARKISKLHQKDISESPESCLQPERINGMDL